MRGPLAIGLATMFCSLAIADVYKWKDEQGVVHYSQTPPPGKPATALGIATEAPRGARPSDAVECQTVQCQYERLRKDRAVSDAAGRAERNAAAQRAQSRPQPRGMSFEVYSQIARGMTEAEVMQRAGAPDHESHDGWRSAKTWTYSPTESDPFTTSVILREGRVFEVERRRKL